MLLNPDLTALAWKRLPSGPRRTFHYSKERAKGMKTIKIYGGLVVCIFTGAAIVLLHGIVQIVIGVTGAFVLVGWLRFSLPVLEMAGKGAMFIFKHKMEMSEQAHQHWMDTLDMGLKEQVVRYAVTRGLNIEVAHNGTISASQPRRNVRVCEERHPVDAPQVEMSKQAALPGPLNECLNLSSAFRPHADTFLSQRGMIVGISGSGKSNTLATVHEEFGRLLVPFLLIDTENEYGSLCVPEYLPRGKRFDVSRVTQENAKEFGRYIIENHLQVILDVTSYEASEAAMVVVNTLAGLQGWEEELDNDDRLSFMVTLSEAGAWFPQSSNAIPYSKDAYTELQTAFFTNLVPRGRKRGLGLIFDLQRPAQVDKRLMQTSWKILHRQTEPRDIEVYKTIAGLEREEVIGLGNGEAYIYTSQVSGQRVQIRQRSSRHESNTPGLESIKRRQYRLSEPDEISEDFGMAESPRNGLNTVFRGFRIGQKDEVKDQLNGIPETTKEAIIGLYNAGRKRTEIQSDMGLNGDEYWMIKTVCDECDREARSA